MLQKDYPFTGAFLEVKTKTPSDVVFKVAGNRDNKSDAISGELEAKYTNRKYGLTFTQAWTTSNVLRSFLEVDNQIANGLKVDVSTALQPDKNTKSALINAAYKQSGLHTRAVLDLLKVCSVFFRQTQSELVSQGPTFTADTVIGRDGFLVGAEAAYNVTEGNITRYSVAAGYNAPEYALTLHGLNNLNTFSASYYHRVSGDVEAGAKAVYDFKATHGGVGIEVGAKT